MEDKSKRLENLSQALNASTIVAYTDPDGIIIDVNRRFCEVSGYSREELIGKTHQIIRSGYHHKEFFTSLWTTIKEGGIWKGEVCNRKKNGEIYWVDTTIIPFKDDSGKIYRFMAIRHEITNLKNALKDLYQSETQLSAIFNSSVDGLVLLDENQKIEKVNSAAARILSICPMASKGLDFNSFVSLSNKAKHSNSYAEVKAYDSTGRELDLFLQYAPLKLGEREMAVVFIRNISEQKLLEEHMQKLGNELDVQTLFNQRLSALASMAGGIAHELNQPLSGIRVYADMITDHLESEQELTKEFMHQTMSKVVGLVDRAADIIQHMREFSAEKKEDFNENCDLHKTLERALSLIGQQLQSSGVQVNVEVDSSHEVCGDTHRLEQVFINLIINARDSIAETGRKYGNISIKSKVHGEVIEVLIEDDGAGIPSEIQAKVFEPFFTSKEPGQGTGLGLPICHGILKDFGAKLSLMGSDQTGTVFKILFKRGKDGQA
ncbi:PAS domain S-box protein [Lentisphaera profundi]|uniref:histidine kinase n=1 Tax=Lentisphaera profundi TaxID=1658616 RepID=A0ABY7VSH3_9BACT|nr:PAS domain S-box protein [Lentisphaera profundi]WDE95724.1 PAS domain S-box protein [Lentisphaera profundi]